MAVDFAAGKLYWADMGVIRGADVADGSNIEDIIDIGRSIWGLETPPPWSHRRGRVDVIIAAA